MQTISVVKVFHISYAHHLPDYDGPCAEVHGHNAKIEVEFTRAASEFDGDSGYEGMLIDFRDIKREVGPFIDNMDHVDLNERIPGIDPPTAENMCLWVKDFIVHNLSIGAHLSRVRVWETEDAYAEWRRDG